MNRRIAKKLRNGDQVKVRINSKEWDLGYIVGDITETTEGIFANIQAVKNGYLCMVRHTDLQ